MENVKDIMVTLNGEARRTGAATVGGLLRELGVTKGRVAVEVNLRIVGRDSYEATPISDGDRIEVVNFVGGG